MSSGYYGGAINITTTQTQLAGLYGACVSFFSPAFYSVIISLVWPSKFDWREFLRIDLIEDESSTDSSIKSKVSSTEAVDEAVKSSHEPEKQAYLTSAEKNSEEKGRTPILYRHQAQSKIPIEDVVHPFDEETVGHIKKWLKIAIAFFVVNVLVTCVLWPLPLYRNWIFTKSFFGGWVTMVSLSIRLCALLATSNGLRQSDLSDLERTS